MLVAPFGEKAVIGRCVLVGAKSQRVGGLLWRTTVVVCSHINSHDQVRGHRAGSSHSGVEKHPREKRSEPKVVHMILVHAHIYHS